IFFYGRLERVTLFDLFGVMDLTVAPSLCYENSPTVIFESFYCGVPVVASDIEGIAELIREGENGLMFAAGDSRALLAKIIWAEENRAALRLMGEAAMSSLKSYSQEKYISRLESLYQATPGAI
ncbi:MAG: glycosyltransferase, partial [Patescibacteria group bacterium]